MGVYRYNPTVAVVADGPSYPSTTDSTGYTSAVDNGTFLQAATTPGATPIPAGHGISGIQVRALASCSSGGYDPSLYMFLLNSGGSAVAYIGGVSIPRDGVKRWYTSTLFPMNVDPSQAAAFLSSASFRFDQQPAYSAAYVTLWAAYAEVVTYVGLEAVIPANLTGPGEMSQKHIGGEFLSLVIPL